MLNYYYIFLFFMTLRSYPEEVTDAIKTALYQDQPCQIVVHDLAQAEAGRRELEQRLIGRTDRYPAIEFVIDARHEIGSLLM